MMRRHWVLGLVAAALTAVGCQSTLEDGYKPRPLNASTAQRRAYYASPFTPEAAAAEQEHPNDSGKVRQPGSY